jgi:hypothetical protein
LTTDTCTHRDYLPTDDDFPNGPRCERQAEYTTCEPMNGRVCAAHRCRCSKPLYHVRQATRAELQQHELDALRAIVAKLPRCDKCDNVALVDNDDGKFCENHKPRYYYQFSYADAVRRRIGIAKAKT